LNIRANSGEMSFQPNIVSTSPDMIFYYKDFWFAKLSSGVEMYENK